MREPEAPTLPLYLARPIALGLALMSGKTIVAAEKSELILSAPLSIPAMMHDHLLVIVLFLFIDLFVVLKGRQGGEEGEAVSQRAMTFVFGLALLWVALSVPIAKALGGPATIAQLREAGGTWALVLSGLDLSSALGLILVVAIGVGSALKLRRAERKRVLLPVSILALLIAIVGPLGRDTIASTGLELDPFAVVIQATWQGLQSVTGS